MKNKDTFGVILFVLSIIIFGYMLFNPLTHLITHVDELFTLSIVNFPIGEILHITSGDFNPPLYYLLSKLAVKVLGGFNINTLETLKLVSILPYLFIIIISGVKIRNDYGWFTAGLFAISVGVMSEFFGYFLTARMYSWTLLFLVIAFIFFRDIIEEDDRKAWIIFTVASILCAYTHYYGAISVACIYILLACSYFMNEKFDIRMFAISLGALIISYVPWIFTLWHQIEAIMRSSWIAPVDLNLIVGSLGYFASAGDLILSVISILVLIIVAAAYFTYAQSEKIDRFYVMSGIGVFVLTILIGIVLSVVINPMLVLRFLIPASAVLWLSISIMIGQINRSRMFLISFAIMALLLVAGIGNMLTCEAYADNAIDEIASDDSIVILTSPKSMIYFLNLDNRTDLYCINHDYVYGENINTVHKIFDFKSISQNEIRDLASNNTDKNIYLVTWGDADSYSNFTTDSILNDNGLEILKIDTSSLAPTEEEEYYY